MLLAKGIEKAFGSHVVLRDINISLEKGTITALLGANGAGKSTLLRILGGVLSPTAGSVVLNGSKRTISSISSARRAGIVSAFQEGSLIPAWKVKEHFRDSSAELNPWLKMAPGIDGDDLVEILQPSDGKLVEIARALAANPVVLLADEPTAGLSHLQRDRVFAGLGQAARKGSTILLATHDLKAALSQCDRILVLKQGRVALQAASNECTLDVVLEAMGAVSEPHRLGSRVSHVNAPPSLVIEIPSTGTAFEVHKGEIVGIAGAVSSIARDLLRVLYGLSDVFVAHATLDSQPLPQSPVELFPSGIVYVSRERSSEWNFVGQTVEFNLVAAVFERLTHIGIIDLRETENVAQGLQQKFDVSSPSLRADIDVLSGGNRQKVVLARGISTGPRFLLLDEPFSGVDQATRSKLFGELRRVTEAGTGVLIYSQELADLVKATDRIILCQEDATATEFISHCVDARDLERMLAGEAMAFHN